MKPLLVAGCGGFLVLAPAAGADPATVSLHVDSPYVVQIERRATPGEAWGPVCINPCDVQVPAAGEYRIHGRGVTSSAPLTLHPEGSSVVLQVAPGSKDKERTGWFVMGGAAAAVLVGAVIDAVGTQQGTVAGEGGPGDPGTASNAKINFYLAGTALVIAGLAGALYGGSLVYGNARSAVRENDPPPPEASQDPVTREMGAALARAPALVLPVFTAPF